MSIQVTMKPLKGENFQVEVKPEDKIGDLKKKIAEAKSEYPADSLKLILTGKILSDDEATIADTGYKPENFIVIMVTKAKPAATPAAAPAAAAATTPAAAPAATPAAAPDATATAAATVVSGAASEATITQLCDMGFERDQVVRCLQAAFGNPDRAVEYLMSGIPEGALPPPGGAAPTPAAPTAGATGGGGAGGMAFPAMPPPGAGGGTSAPLPPALQELRNNPQFAQLAAMVAQNPQMLEQMLPAIAQSNPEIVQAIQQNPDAFMQMLAEAGAGGGGAPNDPVAAMMGAAGGGAGGGRAAQLQQLATMMSQNPAMIQQMLPELLPEIEANDPAAAAAIRENPQLLVQMLQAEAAGGGGMGMGGPPPGAQVVSLSEEDNAAVERLTQLGFDRNAAAQAYLACDKNEELAANFLFDNGGD